MADINFNVNLNNQSSSTTSTQSVTQTPNGASTTSTTQATQSNTPAAKEGASRSQALAIAGMMMSQSLNYATSNVEKWTGSTSAQMAVNNTKTAVGLGFAFAVNPYLAAAQVGLQLGTTAINNYVEDKRNSREVARSRARAGYNSANWRY